MNYIIQLVWVLVKVKELQEMSNELAVQEVVSGINCSQAPVRVVGSVRTETELSPSPKRR